MKRAFDDNVANARPKLRLGRVLAGQVAVTLDSPEEGAAQEERTETAIEPEAAEIATPDAARVFEPAPVRSARAVSRVAAAAPAPGSEADVVARKRRVEEIKRRLKYASAPAPEAAPADPAPGAVLLAHEMQARLAGAMAETHNLRRELDEARGALAAAIGESRARAAEVEALRQETADRGQAAAAAQSELEALEEERDAALERCSALAALNAEHERLAESLERRAAEAEQAREKAEGSLAHAAAREASLGAELRAARAECDLARAERDEIASRLSRSEQERASLESARAALDEIHRALSSVRARG